MAKANLEKDRSECLHTNECLHTRLSSASEKTKSRSSAAKLARQRQTEERIRSRAENRLEGVSPKTWR